MGKIQNYFNAYLVVAISGDKKERLINLAVREGLHIWDLQYSDHRAVCKIRAGDYFKLRPLVKKTRCPVKILHKVGYPFFLNRIKKRRGLILGMLTCMVMLYLLTSSVWFIQVSGQGEVEPEKILLFLHDLGVRPGIKKTNLDLIGLANEVITHFEEIVWASATLNGSLLEVFIVEKQEPPPEQVGPTDLVAARDGLVVDVMVLAGEPRVSAGDTVKRGDLLIEGIETSSLLDPENNSIQLSFAPTRARGVVEARVWYEGVGLMPRQEPYTVATGAVKKNYHVRFKQNLVNIWGDRNSPFRNYQLEKINHYLVWRNLTFPVELITIVYREVEVKRRELTVEEALKKAGEEAEKMLLLQLSPAAPIIRKHLEDRVGKDGVSRKILLETRENIAVPSLKKDQK